jgi:hypothetical protein
MVSKTLRLIFPFVCMATTQPGSTAVTQRTVNDLQCGNHVRIRRSGRSPYAGRTGVLSAIDPGDPYRIYLVRFEDGLQFRYERGELEPLASSSTYLGARPVRKALRLWALITRRTGDRQAA